MDKKDIKLAVNNLKISFRTANGKVQAVRNIDFDLYQGETLAIVGESGSGKSVTTRAILGILAVNAIKESGEIIYDGEDLMKISEEGYHKIRGDKIAMIFQDPLSSLNPIMRIGRQLTEAMIIKGKINQKESRKDFNSMLELLQKYMDLGDKTMTPEEHKKLCRTFNSFEVKQLSIEKPFNEGKEAIKDSIEEIDDVLFHIEKNATDGLEADLKEVFALENKMYNPYLVSEEADALKKEMSSAKKALNAIMRQKKGKRDSSELVPHLEAIRDILKRADEKTAPAFFSLGYYEAFGDGEKVDFASMDEYNEFLNSYCDEHFLNKFKDVTAKALKYSHDESIENSKNALAEIEKGIAHYSDSTVEISKKDHYISALTAAAENAIDRLEPVKDNALYTFGTRFSSAVESYVLGVERNAKEEKRYNKQKAAYDRLVASGRKPDWKVADKDIIDLDEIRADIVSILERVKTRLETVITEDASYNPEEKTHKMIVYFRKKASGVSMKVTKSMAKARALKLMEEVGISEPRRRYRQYPFEFSGGMRQRIVIAIALSANPDILICDEPTTALDVTIQSQILELINKVKKERNISVIFITHDLGVVANMADRVAVMYAGKIVEIGTAEDIFYNPAHPYTWALLSSMPDLETKERLESIPGTPPNMIYPPKGDAFAARNKYAMEIDFEEEPPMFKISDTHYAATWLLHPDAPKVEIPKGITERIERMRKAEEGYNFGKQN